jgi:hypothetical protein
LDRAAIVLTAQAASFQPDGSSNTNAFLPSLGLSYSLTSEMSLIGAVERDFPDHLTVSRAGARFHIADFGEGSVGLGAALVNYSDDGRKVLALKKDTAFEASAHGSWPVSHYDNGATCFWLVASASRDLDNGLTTIKGGLRWQVVGGRPE